MAGFKVDTKIFQELGELLVAKESTALVELIKNAYDADATLVTVTGTNLGDRRQGLFVVTDNGVGMTSDEFQRGFLTIAGRTKNVGDRRSPVFGRRYTGEKGVGRLASHKLGRVVQIESRKAGTAPRGAIALPSAVSQLSAKIDWDAIERLQTLDEIPKSGAVTFKSVRIATLPRRRGRESGTTLSISPLRTAWAQRIKTSFLSEAATLAPLAATWKSLPPDLLIEPLLFDQVPIRDQGSSDPGFEVVFGGELSLGDQLLPDVANRAHWIAELAYERRTGLLQIAVAPTTTGRRGAGVAEGFSLRHQLGRNRGPSFRGRILQLSRDTWDPAVQGIRIFMEGFRVPPYGERHDDWLGLESTYLGRQKRRLISLSSIEADGIPDGLENEEIMVQGNAAYLGGIFLHRESSPGLEMLVNREGFLPGPELEFITDWTRVATDLIVRLGSLARREVKVERDGDRERQRAVAARSDVNETPTALRVRESALAVEQGFKTISAAVERNEFAAAAAEARRLQPSLAEIRDLADQFGSEAVQWRVLASLGAELAAFVHEINAVGLQISGLARQLEEALSIADLTRTRSAIRRARRGLLDLADRIRRNATYLVDTTSFEGRRRRTRQPLRERFETVELFFRTRIDRKHITLENEIPSDLRTPPMFPSELSGIFTNLLSNAVKFTDDGGRIRVAAQQTNGFFEVEMANTGSAVDIARSAQLFEAFRSTTERPDAVLGQGMGMGLTITRAFIQEYGGYIVFRRPPEGFATSIAFSIPTA